MRLGLREANQQFGIAMRAVRSGEEVVITDRGRPFAVILPYHEEQGLQRLIEAGVLHAPATARRQPVPKPVKLRGAVKPSALLEEDRRS